MSKEKTNKIKITLGGKDGKIETYEYDSYEDIPEDIKERTNMWMEEAFKDTKFKFPGKLLPEAFRQYIDSGQYAARVLEEDMFVNRSGKNCLKEVILVVVEDGGDKYFIQIDIILTQVGPEEYEITVHNVSEMKSLDLFDLVPKNYKDIRELLNDPKDKLLEKIVKSATKFEK